MNLETISQIEDLYRYNDWANGRLFQMCDGLTNAQLDDPRELGFGSLRNTLFHILTAEQIWLERWQLVPWRPFPTDAQGLDIEDIRAQLRQISQARFQMIQAELDSGRKRDVTFKDSRGNEYREPLDVLLLHVANHSHYHRGQALNYLKKFGRTTPIGLDYLLYKLARPTLQQPSESVRRCQEMGLQVAHSPGWMVKYDGELLERFVRYGQWATDQILAVIGEASDELLDRDFQMGPGSIRQTLLHMLNVERKWSAIFAGTEQLWQPMASATLTQLHSGFAEVYADRLKQIDQLDQATAQAVVIARPGGVELNVRRLEGLVQLCCHGTHHRAQLINMLRHSRLPVPANDLVDWWRQRTFA